MCSHKSLDVNSALAQAIESQWPVQTFKQSFDLFYAGQVPNVATFLKEGRAIAVYNENGKKKEKILSAPMLIGANELLEQGISNCSIKIVKDSQASVFDRMTFQEYLNKHADLKAVLLSE